MPKYEVEYTYNIPTMGSEFVSADDEKSAEYIVERELAEDPDLTDVEITGVRLVNNGDEGN